MQRLARAVVAMSVALALAAGGVVRAAGAPLRECCAMPCCPGQAEHGDGDGPALERPECCKGAAQTPAPAPAQVELARPVPALALPGAAAEWAARVAAVAAAAVPVRARAARRAARPPPRLYLDVNVLRL